MNSPRIANMQRNLLVMLVLLPVVVPVLSNSERSPHSQKYFCTCKESTRPKVMRGIRLLAGSNFRRKKLFNLLSAFIRWQARLMSAEASILWKISRENLPSKRRDVRREVGKVRGEVFY